VGLTLFDLRRRGKVGKLSMVGTSGSKFSAIRTSVMSSNETCGNRLTASGEHLERNIFSVYNNLDVSFDSFPSDTSSRDPDAYKYAIGALSW